MRVLAIDTATELMSLAFLDGKRRYLYTRDGGLRHAETLMPEILSIVGRAAADSGQPFDATSRRLALAPDLVVCTRGPGSFTGLRIGMATAKGIAAGADCPVISIPTLEAYAWHIRHLEGTIIPAVDAKKSRFYCRLLRQPGEGTEDLDADVSTILRLAAGSARIFLTGPDAAALQAAMAVAAQNPKPPVVVDPACRSGCGDALLSLGMERFEAGNVDDEEQGPVYVRESDAELGLRVQPPKRR